MFRLAFDRPNVIAVGVFSGRLNQDADFQEYIASFPYLDDMAMQNPHIRAVYAVVVDPENEMPNAVWRRRIADASAHLRSNPLVSMVTKSVAVRGIVTAINWIRPPPYEIKCHETIDLAAAWIQSQREGDIAGIMSRLERDCRERGTGRLMKTV